MGRPGESPSNSITATIKCLCVSPTTGAASIRKLRCKRPVTTDWSACASGLNKCEDESRSPRRREAAPKSKLSSRHETHGRLSSHHDHRNHTRNVEDVEHGHPGTQGAARSESNS